MNDTIYPDEEEDKYYIFYDRQIKPSKWAFVDTRNGHLEWFDNREKALKYLKVYKEELEYLDNNRDQVRLYE